jgi:two-component system cell cycle sensor histidine kinase/response regulator CckA
MREGGASGRITAVLSGADEAEPSGAGAAAPRGPELTVAPRPRRGAFEGDPWAAPLILGLVAAGGRLVAPGPPWTSLLSISVGVGAVAPMVYRSRHSLGLARQAWALFALSLACATVGTVLSPWDGVAAIATMRGVFDMGTYGLGALGVVLFARDYGRADPDAWLDAAAVGVVLSSLVTELIVVPRGTFLLPGRPPLYPIVVAAVDAIVFTTLARLVIRPVAHRSLSGIGVVIGLALVLDATYYTTGAGLGDRPLYEAAWMIAFGAWGAAAIHPDTALLASGRLRVPRTVQDDIRGAFRAVGLFNAGFAASCVLLVLDIVRNGGTHAPLLMAALVLLVALAGARSIRVVKRLADDVEQRTRVEARLRDSEERFRRLAEAAPVGIFVADATGRAQFVNEAWSRITGKPAADAPGGDFVDGVHPDDRDWLLAAWTNGVEAGEPISAEHRMLRPDGTVGWVDVRAVPLPAADGQSIGWVGTVADVTVLKEATAAAEEREAFFNGMIEQSPIGIGVYGLDGALIGLNEAERRIRGRIAAPRQVADVRSDPLMLQLGQRDAVQRAYAGETAAGEPTPVSAPTAGTAGSDDDERVWLRLRWYPMRDGDGRVIAVISFTEDVTETVEADARERRVGEKLQEAAKLEALGVLAGGIAHDFNNLLVPIIGYVDLAIADAPSDSTVTADLEAARTAAGRAADLARQMLAYSGRGAFSVGPVVLEELLGEIGDLMARSIAKGARLRYAFTADLPPVLADATQLRQVALNLIVNASDALGGHPGDITLRTAMTTLEPDDPDVIPGGSAAPGEYVMLEVSDTGSGMDPATLARIFDPFFSTKSVGRGLGLAATLGIVKGHGGAIRVSSAPGKGSVFAVLLRPWTDVPASPVAALPVQPAERVVTGRVLMVDDEPTVREIGRRILERAGYTVEEAGDGPEAIERFRSDPTAFDSILLDLTLPSLDGLAVMRELRSLRADLPVVLCSGWSADEVADGLRSLPRTVFLQKPYQGQALVEALSSVARMPMADG